MDAAQVPPAKKKKRAGRRYRPGGPKFIGRVIDMPHRCSLCGLLFSNKRNCNRHSVKAHNGLRVA